MTILTGETDAAHTTMTANIGDETIVMSQEPRTDSKIHYSATFAAQDAAAHVVVSFVRRNGKSGAPYSTVVVPAAVRGGHRQRDHRRDLGGRGLDRSPPPSLPDLPHPVSRLKDPAGGAVGVYTSLSS